MENKVYPINYRQESTLHFMKKIKGEIIEKAEGQFIYDSVEREVWVSIVEFLDSKIYQMEEEINRNKKEIREDKREGRSSINRYI